MNILKTHFKQMNYYRDNYGVNLTNKQYKAIKKSHKNMDFNFDRNEGCSTACIIKAMELAIKDNDNKIAIFNSSLISASYQFDNACKIIENNKISSHVSKKHKKGDTHEIEFFNGSKINFLGKPNDNVRGRRSNFDFAIIDGAKYFNEEQLKAINLLTSKGCVMNMNQSDISLEQTEGI